MTRTTGSVLSLPPDPPEQVAAVLRSIETTRDAWSAVAAHTAAAGALLSDGWSGPAAEACQRHLAADRRRWTAHVDLATDQTVHLTRYLDLLVVARARIEALRTEHTRASAEGDALATRAAAGTITPAVFDAEAVVIAGALDRVRAEHAAVLNEVAAQAAVTNVVLLAGEADDKTAGRPDLDQILRDYQVRADDVREWRVGGVVGWLGSRFKEELREPRELPAAEAEMLDDLTTWQKIRFFSIQQQALRAAERRFPGAPGEDGHVDAFRHAYWNALLVWEFGPDWAARYTTAHEAVVGSPAAREAMDLFNNETGRALSLETPLHRDDEELQDKIAAAIDAGVLVVVGVDGRLRWSDEVEMGETVDPRWLDGFPSRPGRPIDEFVEQR